MTHLLDTDICIGVLRQRPGMVQRLIQKLREYKAVYVLNDAEIGLFSDEVVVNCAP